MTPRVLKPIAPRFVLARAQDRPGAVNLVLTVAVAAHAATTLLGYLPNPWTPLTASTDVVTLYLSLAGPAAIVSGFAGVVVVFGLTLNSPRFRQFRVRAGRQLRATWTSTSTCGFITIALSIAAALLATVPLTGRPPAGPALAAPWLFELAAVILTHGVLRLLWILRRLIVLIQSDDQDAVHEAARTPLERLPFNRRRA